MRKMLLVSAALAAALGAGSAQAAIITYNVTGSFVVGAAAAGGISGSFTYNNTTNAITAVNLTTTGNTVGAFTYVTTTYNSVGNVSVQSLPSFFQMDIAGANNKQLRLIFNGGLTAAGGSLTTSSYENQTAAGTRTISVGAATAQVSAVPEPATWAMMLVGFGAIGFAARSRTRVRAAVSFA